MKASKNNLWLKILIPAVIVIAAAAIAIVFCCKEPLDANMEFIPDAPVTKAIYDAGFAGGAGWFYSFDINYTGNTDLTITESYEVSKSSVSDEEFTHSYDDTTIDMIFGSHVITPGDNFRWNGGMPLQDISSITLVVKGTDANGETHEFSGTIELSQEIIAEEPAQESDVITIVPAENPVSPNENEDFVGGAGWFYAFEIANTGDANVTITSLKGLSTNSENGEVYTDNYPEDLINNVFGSNVLAAGQSARFTGGMPVQDISMYELVISFTDADGNAYESRGSVEFVK